MLTFGLVTRAERCLPYNALQARSRLPTSFRRSTKRGPEKEVGEQPYCHTNAVDIGLAQIQFVFLARCASLC